MEPASGPLPRKCRDRLHPHRKVTLNIDSPTLLPLPSEVLVTAQSGEYRADQEGVPNPYKPAAEPAFRERIVELLLRLTVAHLSTLASDGWPVGNAVRF